MKQIRGEGARDDGKKQREKTKTKKKREKERTGGGEAVPMDQSKSNH
jgi:hypothetical protein